MTVKCLGFRWQLCKSSVLISTGTHDNRPTCARDVQCNCHSSPTWIHESSYITAITLTFYFIEQQFIDKLIMQ